MDSHNEWVQAFMEVVFSKSQRNSIVSTNVDLTNSHPPTTTWLIECSNSEAARSLMEDFKGDSVVGNNVRLTFRHDGVPPSRLQPEPSSALMMEEEDVPTIYTLFVGNLQSSASITSKVLLDLFQKKFPSCESAFVVPNRGYGFVRFRDISERENALAVMDNHLLNGVHLHVAIPKSDSPAAGHQQQQQQQKETKLIMVKKEDMKRRNRSPSPPPVITKKEEEQVKQQRDRSPSPPSHKSVKKEEVKQQRDRSPSPPSHKSLKKEDVKQQRDRSPPSHKLVKKEDVKRKDRSPSPPPPSKSTKRKDRSPSPPPSKRSMNCENDTSPIKRPLQDHHYTDNDDDVDMKESNKPKKSRKAMRKNSVEDDYFPTPPATSTTPSFETLFLLAEKEATTLRFEKRILEFEIKLSTLDTERNNALRLLALAEQQLSSEQHKTRLLEFQLCLEQSKTMAVFSLKPLLDHWCQLLFPSNDNVVDYTALTNLLTKRSKSSSTRLSTWSREKMEELESEWEEEEKTVVDALMDLPNKLHTLHLHKPHATTSLTGFHCANNQNAGIRVAVGLCVLQCQLLLLDSSKAHQDEASLTVMYVNSESQKFRLKKGKVKAI